MLLSVLLILHSPVMVNMISIIQSLKEMIEIWEQFPFWPVVWTSLREYCNFPCFQTGSLVCAVIYSSSVLLQHLDLVQPPWENLPEPFRKDITELKTIAKYQL